MTDSLSGGISGTLITNDSYLIIVVGDNKDTYNVTEFDKKTAKIDENLLNTSLKTTISKVALAGLTSPIVQNLASKKLSSATLGRINSSLYDIMADGKISVREVGEDFIGSCTNALDNIATNLGFPTPSSLYSAVMPSGSGVISKDFMNLFAKNSEKSNKELDKQASEDKDILIIKLKLVSSDKEDLPIDIPTRKTENNFNIPTSINNQNVERSFETVIVHNSAKGLNMNDVKKQLRQLRDMKRHVDIYINDKDIEENEVIKNCLLSNLSFDVAQVNSINCSIGFTKVPEWDVIIDPTLAKGLSTSTGKGGSKSKRKTTKNSIKNNSTTVQSIRNFEVGIGGAYDRVQGNINNIKTLDPIKDKLRYDKKIQTITDDLNSPDVKANKGYKFSTKEVENIINNGGTVIKI